MDFRGRSVKAVQVAALALLVMRGDLAQAASLPAFDFSFAGYRNSDVAVPYKQRTATISYPAGRFTINSLIRLGSNQVLRGAGKGTTVLVFSKGLKAFGQPCGHAGVDCYDWSNGVIRAQGSEIGIEDLTIEFPASHAWTHYAGTSNSGYNGISLNGCTNCWVKNVGVRNADSGVFVEQGSSKCTLDGVDVAAPSGRKTHVHIAISGFAHHILVKNAKVWGQTFHGYSMNWGVYASVFSNCWGERVYLEADHNCNGSGGAASCSTNTLYTQITGAGNRQTTDRAGRPLKTVWWNIFSDSSKSPVNAFEAQLSARR